MTADIDENNENYFSHKARKRFGQNFLTDDNVINAIVQAINPKSNDCLIEIGPGKGAITLPLLNACPKLTVIELDRDLVKNLQRLQQKYPLLTVCEADALQTDFRTFCEGANLRIVGNLPYNISTPLIFHLLTFNNVVTDMHFMLQKEVVDRLCAEPNSKSYGRLSVMVQYYAEVEALFKVPPESFDPAPKVTSAVVRITPHRASHFPELADNEAHFRQFVTDCFQTRRKTLRNNLKKRYSEDIIQRLPIDVGRRPETLSVAEFVSLSNFIVRD